MAAEPQTLGNHARFLPGFHFVAAPILLIVFLWSLWRMVADFSVDHVLFFLLATGTLVTLFVARIMALTVQDRVIRLEMRIRLAQLLPNDLRPRLHELTPRQLVALRFASDEELPDLVRTVLTDNIRDGRAIKKMIRNWQGDYLRA
jgi:hypothetical protein